MQVLDGDDFSDDMFSLHQSAPPHTSLTVTYRVQFLFRLGIVLPELHIDSHEVHIGPSHPSHQLDPLPSGCGLD